MRSTYLFLSVAASLASAFVILDESILAEIVSETRPATNDPSQADAEMSLLGISPDEHRGWGRDGDWRDDDEYPEHGDWLGYGRWPGGDRPRHGGWPEHGEWPGYRGDCEDRHDRDGRPWDRYRHRPHRPIDACPGPFCHADKTTWELIRESEHTSRLAELIADDKDLIDILNGTTANHTFFALTNRALERLPRGRNGPSPKLMSKLLRYHILPGQFSIEHIAGHGTLPTKLTEPALESTLPQRIVVREHQNGVMLNRRSRVVAADMKSKNGIIHIITSPLHPPPETRTILHQAPTDFSALARTKLAHNLDPAQRQGGTTFVPTNVAFRRLGEKANRFLFSRRGEGCLRTLMQYHIVLNQTFYSDVLYSSLGTSHGLFSGRHGGHAHEGEGKGGRGDGLEEDYANVRLVTLLKRELRVDVKKGFGEVDMRVNGFGRVGRMDLLARDGVVHVLDRVLIPPRKIQDQNEDEDGELIIEELVGRLDGCVYGMTRGEL
ncbi:FAS1 domain [Penicillium roqueforti FM164]|uniref:FAS1 domain n=1 Tax=Penicillium roqueforti (strain FM164) TaxID=1365484 RepID=W6QKT3_PENRF|nr:FAS1 domain [Penicillium roqueforti FM164]